MKISKRILSVVLAVVMAVTLMVPAFAADAGKTYKKYTNYMCIGDSIAAGCGLSRDGSETYCDPDVKTSEEANKIYDASVIYRGMDFSVAHTGYHALVRDALKTNLWQCARSGFRATEIRYILGGGYNDFDEARIWGNTYWDEDGNGFTTADIDAIAKRIDFVNRVKKADVITLEVGSNDVFSVTLGAVLNKMTTGNASSELKLIGELFEKNGNFGQAFGSMLQACDGLMDKVSLGATVLNYFNKTLLQFKENYDWVIKKIYELNPDVEIVAVGVYNPFRYFRTSADSSLDFSALAQPIVTEMNKMIQSYVGDYSGKYFYADITDTDTYPMNYDDPWFWEYFTLKVHPTIAGHRYIADQILKALPDASSGSGTGTGTGGKTDPEQPESTKIPVVKASNDPYNGKVFLTWAPVDNAKRYNVYRSTSKTGEFRWIGDTSRLYYTNNNGRVNVKYYYKVTATLKDGSETDFSNTVVRVCDCAAPIVRVSNVASTGKIKLSWDKVEGAAKYEVYRALSENGTYTKLTTVKGTSVTNTSALPGFTYYYKVKAISQTTSEGNSAFSEIVKRCCDCAKPTVKVSLNSAGHPVLSWAKVDSADKYIVYRATTKNGTYTKLTTTKNTKVANTSAKAGVTYYYKVKAVSSRSANSASAYSAVVSIRAK